MAGIIETKPATPHEPMVYQGVAIRFVALLIDNIILAAIILKLEPMLPLSVWSFIAFIIYTSYYTYFEGTRGQTIGKMTMKISVVREDGSPIDMSTAFIRTILRIIDGLLIYLVGAIFIWTSHKKQRLGDRAAKTVVIKA